MTGRWVVAGLAACIALQACAPNALTPSPSPAAPTPAEPQLASFSPAPSAAVDTSLAARPAAAPRALLIDDDGTGLRLRARPIDHLTLADVPGYAPISFGHHYVARTSPDGSTVVAILWPGGSTNSGATIHVIDTTSWIDRQLGAKVDTYVTAMQFDATGQTVYWVASTAITPTSESSALFALDVGRGTVREIARFSDGYAARDLGVVGSRIAVWLVPTSLVMIDGRPRDLPQVAVAAAAGGIDATVSLPGIHAGQLRDVNAEDGYRSIEPGLAWDLPRARLYVADAESDRIFTVDLASATLSGPVVPARRRSFVDVLWSLVGSAAEAKRQSSTRQRAALSADGRWLYVSGERSDFTKGSDGKVREVVTPLQLRVIDPTDLSLSATIDDAATWLWPAPSGTRLLYPTSRTTLPAEGFADRLDWRLHVTDGAVTKEVASIPFEGQPWLLAFDGNRGVAYLDSLPAGGGTSGRATVLALDLVNGSVTARRETGMHYADVILLPGP